jgi:hypothetical protein
MDALATAGFDEAGVALAFQTLVSFLDGALLHWPWTSSGMLGWEGVVDSVDPARYPRIVATARHARLASWDEVFATGLDLFLGGLESMAERPVAFPQQRRGLRTMRNDHE